MRKSVFALMALAAFLFAGCEEENTFTREFEEATMELSKDVANVAETGTSDVVTVTTDETAIDVTVEYAYKSWLSASLSGKTITIKVIADNPTIEERSGKIVVTAGSNGKTVQKYITVKQAGADPSTIPALSLESTTVTIENCANASATLAINTNQTPVAATSSAAWLSVSIEGSNLVVTALTDNPEYAIRTATVTVTAGKLSVDLDVTQKPAVDSESLIATVYKTEGVIFWQNPENKKQVKIISARAEKMAWSNPVEATGATSDEATGEGNNAIVKAWASYGSATSVVKYCAAMGEGWYQPSVTELKDLFLGYNSLSYDECTNEMPASISEVEKQARAKFDAALESIGGVKLNTQGESQNGDSIWACRENSDGTKAYYVRYGKKGSDMGTKTSTSRFGRCVKVVTVE